MQVTPHQARQTYAAQSTHDGAKREHAGGGVAPWLVARSTLQRRLLLEVFGEISVVIVDRLGAGAVPLHHSQQVQMQFPDCIQDGCRIRR